MMNDPSTSAHFIQDGLTACFAAHKKKGGCKGKNRGKIAYPVRPSNLSIEDRRKKLAELKAKSECKACGRKGHWKGDKQCTMTKTGMFAVASVSQSIPIPNNRPSSSGMRMMIDIDEEGESVAYVAVQGGALPKPVAKAVQQAETRTASIAFEEPTSMDWGVPEARVPPAH